MNKHPTEIKQWLWCTIHVHVKTEMAGYHPAYSDIHSYVGLRSATKSMHCWRASWALKQAGSAWGGGKAGNTPTLLRVHTPASSCAPHIPGMQWNGEAGENGIHEMLCIRCRQIRLHPVRTREAATLHTHKLWKFFDDLLPWQYHTSRRCTCMYFIWW